MSETCDHFHIVLHAHPSGEVARAELDLPRYGPVEVITIDPRELGAFECTFDDAAAALMRVDRIFFEPDGSFIWTGTAAGTRWQIDGLLVDAGPRLAHLELKGTCRSEVWETLLATLGWPGQRVVVQMVREGVLLEEPEFRRVAGL